MDDLDFSDIPTKSPLNALVKKKWFWIVLAIIIVIIFIIAIVSGSSDENTTSKPVEKKIVTVQSTTNELSGTVGIEPTSKGTIRANYKLKVNTTLPTNWVCKDPEACGEPHNEYTYISDLVIAGKEGEAEGSFSAIYCNLDQDPGDPYDVSSSPYYDCPEIKQTPLPTATTFFASFSKVFDSYDDFLKATTLNVHDASQYWQIESSEQSGNESTRTYGVDDNKAAQETAPVKTFTLILE